MVEWRCSTTPHSSWPTATVPGVIRSAIVLRPSTILEFHRALRTRKYRWLFSPKRRRTGPQGPSKALVDGSLLFIHQRHDLPASAVSLHHTTEFPRCSDVANRMATHITSKDREPLSGLVERVTFHSPDTGFCVLRVKVRGHRDLVTVLGSAASIQPGEFIQASGRWDNHREHGLQFRTTFLQVMPPSSLEGIEKYLGSGMIRGIGPHFAKKLVTAFG